MKKTKILLILPFLLFLTGCWNYNELNTLAIATGMAIDKSKDGYEVSLLIANSKKVEESSKEGEAQTIVYSGRGKTISQAMKDIDLVSSKQLYIGHLSVIIVSDKVAKEGLINTLDFLLREPESIKRFYIALARNDKAKDILKILSPLESFPSQNIYSNIKFSSESHAISASVAYGIFIEELLAKGKETTLPSMVIKGNEKKGSKSSSLEESTPKAEVKLNTLGLFKKDKLITYATANESRGINLIKSNVDEMILSTNCKGGTAIAKLNDIKTNYEVTKKSVNINLNSTAYIRESNCTNDLNDSKEITKLEKSFEKNIKGLVVKGIKVAQKNKTDIFGFGNELYKKYPNYFNSIKDIWNDEIFPKYKYHINANIKLKSKGSIEASLKGALHG